jgi:hypothetical protein
VMGPQGASAGHLPLDRLTDHHLHA